LKSNNTPLKDNHPVLTDLLDKYPYFFSQNTNSTHYKYNNTLAGIRDILKHDTEIVTLSNVLNRPLKIWRQQNQPNQYTIGYMVQINEIKRVSLYQEKNGKEDILLKEQNFEEGLNEYENYLELKTNDNIPNTRFYIEVETYSGFVFQKGFPENDTPQNDIYDKDSALDNIGHLYNLPRRKYRTKISEDDYPFTHPPFCNSQSEWDYYYETRLKNHMTSFGKIPLHIQRLENIFEITPEVKGRWRQVARMEQDTMESPDKAKYMASKHYNSNVYDVKYELEDLPRNLKIPDPWDIHNLLEETFPIGAHIFFQITEKYPLKTQIQIKDNITLEIEIKDQIKLNDNMKTEEIKEEAY
jgi:hypothetical protein